MHRIRPNDVLDPVFCETSTTNIYPGKVKKSSSITRPDVIARHGCAFVP